MTEVQAYVACRLCGAPAAAHGEHHHREGPGPVGKGMGGTKDILQRIALCRACHERVQTLEVRLYVNKDMVVAQDKGGHVLSERALVDNDSSEDKRYWSDEHLALMAAQVQERATDLAAHFAEVCWFFKARHAWGDGWAPRAMNAMVEAGYKPHPGLERAVYRRAAMWETYGLTGRWDEVHLLTETVAAAVAESGDPQTKGELAADLYIDKGLPAKEVAARVRAENPEDVVYCEHDECPDCGARVRHRRR